jgi:hypothetical protein
MVSCDLEERIRTSQKIIGQDNMIWDLMKLPSLFGSI